VEENWSKKQDRRTTDLRPAVSTVRHRRSLSVRASHRCTYVPLDRKEGKGINRREKRKEKLMGRRGNRGEERRGEKRKEKLMGRRGNRGEERRGEKRKEKLMGRRGNRGEERRGEGRKEKKIEKNAEKKES
jgi:hypothetical protein